MDEFTMKMFMSTKYQHQYNMNKVKQIHQAQAQAQGQVHPLSKPKQPSPYLSEIHKWIDQLDHGPPNPHIHTQVYTLFSDFKHACIQNMKQIQVEQEAQAQFQRMRDNGPVYTESDDEREEVADEEDIVLEDVDDVDDDDDDDTKDEIRR